MLSGLGDLHIWFDDPTPQEPRATTEPTGMDLDRLRQLDSIVNLPLMREPRQNARHISCPERMPQLLNPLPIERRYWCFYRAELPMLTGLFWLRRLEKLSCNFCTSLFIN